MGAFLHYWVPRPAALAFAGNTTKATNETPMRNRPFFSCLKIFGSAAALMALAVGPGAAPRGPAATALSEERAFLKLYCVTCHNAKLKTAGLELDTLNLGDIPKSGEIMEQVVRKVWSG